MSVKIHQIYYLPEQITKLDPDFIPFDNSALTGTEEAQQQYEWTVLRKVNQLVDFNENNICGFVSHKFKEKTHVLGKFFIKFINENPGCDVYFMEPQFVNNPFFNVWTQGECYHPGIIDLTNRIFELTGTNIDVSMIPMPFCFYNAFAGNQKFWDCLLLAIDNIFKAAKLDPKVNEMLFSKSAGYEPNNTLAYFPFVAERIASTIMATNDLKIAKMPYYNSTFVYRSNNMAKYFDSLIKDGLPLMN